MRKIGILRAQFLKWYEENKRDLPWRETTDPYTIWLSEIILQQTRIDQGLAYFMRFAEKFPTVDGFASASEDEILKLWQGLGYYSRARNMHIAAKAIVTEYNSQFPADYKKLLNLKGVGDYTAAAIASIAFNLPHATVDGNVYRVLSRVFGIETPIDSSQGKKEFSLLANQLLDHNQPGNFNQALMEFGALQCSPKKPNCENCPINNMCVAFNNDTIEKLPVKKGKVKIRNRYFNYLVIDHGKYTFLKKRTENDVWKNLYEFPLTETKEKTELDHLITKEQKYLPDTSNFLVNNESSWKKQVLSHQHIYYRFIYLQITDKKNIPSGLIKVNKKDIFNFAVPKPIEKELENYNWH
ncbi:A/G-specific adenine glycosylase [Sunxiuqinia indica]|uniref:A/G-specific adenine glycosylase n=1 Tax=Sunxiuqinia indica TaxID=2692584 RepID=UPI001357FC44|nr:A/G-specific adenine glycosylase [Sunxiuqinia indica]